MFRTAPLILALPIALAVRPPACLSQSESFSTPTVLYQEDANNSIYSFDIGDVNEDGNADVLLSLEQCKDDNSPNLCTYFWLLTGHGDGTFSVSSLPDSSWYAIGGGLPFVVKLMDENQDGHLDLVAVTTNSPLNFMLVIPGDGKGNFGSPVVGNLPGGASTVAFADLNHDGLMDIAIVNTSASGPSSSLDVYLNQGDGSLFPFFGNDTSLAFRGTFGQFSPYYGSTGIAVGDFTGDGNMDLAVPGEWGNAYQVKILKNDGAGNFTDNSTYTFDSVPFCFQAADLYGDGKTELLVSLDAKPVPGAHPRIAVLKPNSRNRLYWSSAMYLSKPVGYFTVAPLGGSPRPDIIGGLEDATTSAGDFVLNGFRGADMVVYSGVPGQLGKFARSATLQSHDLSAPIVAAPLRKGARPSIFYNDTRFPAGPSSLKLMINKANP